MNNPFEKKNELQQKELDILKEVRQLAKKPFLKITDILEWSASRLEHEYSTDVFYLPDAKVYVRIDLLQD